MDNLPTEKKCEEMIIVMNSGYAYKPDGTGHPSFVSIDEEIVKYCIPCIYGKCRTKAEKALRHGRPVDGVMQSNATVMKNPAVFANEGIFSGGFSYKGDG